MRTVIVLPSIVPEFTLACLATISPDIIDVGKIPGPPTLPQWEPLICGATGEQWTDGWPDVRLVVIWNSPDQNLGCAGSWNIGIDVMQNTDADWLVILSAAVRFGPKGGTDFLRWLDDFRVGQPDVLGVEAAGGLGWHLLAFPRHVIDKVGRFDPMFYPAYFEDNDYSVRIQRAYDRDTKAPGFQGPLWPKVETDATLVEVAHGIKHSGVHVDMAGLREKFVAKWGPNEEYRTPYNGSLDWTYVGGHA